MLPSVGTGFVFASHYAGKTALVVDLIAAMTGGAGQIWSGRAVKPLAPRETVLIVAFEGHLGLKGRVTAASKHRNGNISPNIHMIVPDGGKQAIQAIRAELEVARQLGEPCAFVMVDTWSAARFTLDDNNANEVATVLAEFNKLALDYNTCIVFLDHITKNPDTGRSAPRGSGVKLANTSFGYAIDENILTFEKVKDAERPQTTEFETATGDGGAVIIKWPGMTPVAFAAALGGGIHETFDPLKKKHDSSGETAGIKLAMASYANGVGTGEEWGILDAGQFVKFIPALHAQYIKEYGVSDETLPSITMVCTKATFIDGLKNMSGRVTSDAVRMKLMRLKDRGDVLIVDTGRGRVPLVLMRGPEWASKYPW